MKSIYTNKFYKRVFLKTLNQYFVNNNLPNLKMKDQFILYFMLSVHVLRVTTRDKKNEKISSVILPIININQRKWRLS